MMERPILFSAPMVHAILDGKKTQTRRVIQFKRDPKGYSFSVCGRPLLEDTLGDFHAYFQLPEEQWVAGGKPTSVMVKSPYGGTGDSLWVRETFALEQYDDEPKLSNNRPVFHHPETDNEFDGEYWLVPHYKATDPEPELCYDEDPNDDGEPKCKWKPSIHMPRWASRITLQIIDIRVERVRDITRDDAKAEGVSNVFKYRGEIDKAIFKRSVLHPYVANFSVLWDQINAKRGYGWDVNPWVWVVEFKKVTP